MSGSDQHQAAIIVHTHDAELAKGIATALPGLTVLQTAAGDDLGRLLTSEHDIVVLVVHLDVDAERGWRRISLIHDQLPQLPILAYLDPEATPWNPVNGPCPAVAIVRGPTDPGELARAVRVAGSLPVEAASRSGAPALAARSRAVIGLAGGVGATTIAALLGVRQALEGPTILVDLDQRHGAMAGTLRLAPRYTNYDLAGAFDDPDRLDDAMSAVLTPVRDNLHLLAARDEPDVVVSRLGTGDASTLRELVRATIRTGSQVVVDLGDLPLALYPVLSEVAEVIVVASHDIRGIRRLPLALAQLADRAPAATVRTVMNRVVSGMDPSPRQLASLVHRAWDVVMPDLPALQVAQNDTNRDGLLDFAASPPRVVELLTASLLDLEPPPRIGRKTRRRLTRSAPAVDLVPALEVGS